VILAAIWLSNQLDLAYLLSLVCIQADFMLGVWPRGAIFSLANLANLVAPLVFHTVCMVLGGVFFQRGIRKKP